MTSLKILLRHETKKFEQRTPIIPNHAKILIDSGIEVMVESSKTRCFKDEEYEKVGCKIVNEGAWKTCDKDVVVLGLKELPEEALNIVNDHIYFSHCYKGQTGALEVLDRFRNGGGRIFDLEYLTFENGRRVAAFGRAAGIAGMGIGLLVWSYQKLSKEVPPLNPFESTDDMISQINEKLKEVVELGIALPKIIVIGALGRCGSGCIYVAEKCGINVTKWDMEETKKGGPFPEILEHDIFVNCILLTGKIPPFITNEMVQSPDRSLTTVVDVSCDTTNPNNPIPIYNVNTTFESPNLRIINGEKPLDVVSIDNLPSIIPKESSVEFSGTFFQELLKFETAPLSGPWFRTLESYNKHSKL